MQSDKRKVVNAIISNRLHKWTIASEASLYKLYRTFANSSIIGIIDIIPASLSE